MSKLLLEDVEEGDFDIARLRSAESMIAKDVQALQHASREGARATKEPPVQECLFLCCQYLIVAHRDGGTAETFYNKPSQRIAVSRRVLVCARVPLTSQGQTRAAPGGV